MKITEDFLIECIKNAEILKSKLPISISQRPGLSSQKIRHLLNNVCSMKGAKYLNIGLYSGSSFWSAIYNNSLKATGIDYYRKVTKKGTEKEFWKNLAEVISLESRTLNREIHIYTKDCFTLDLKDKYNIYFYDGDHSEEAQYKALKYFDKYLEDEFILMVDDFDDIDVSTGTRRAIKELKYNIKFGLEIKGQFGNWEPSSLTWWNGFLVVLLHK